MLTNDVIKIRYIKDGYLPNYPYHLTSDIEMINSFMSHDLSLSKDLASAISESGETLWTNPMHFVSKYHLKSAHIDTEDNESMIVSGNLYSILKLGTDSGISFIRENIKLSEDTFFSDNYTIEVSGWESEYDALVEGISMHLYRYLTNYHTFEPYTLPDWVYSYMLGTVISSTSSQLDIHDLFVLLDCDNMDDVFTDDAYRRCYEVSYDWVSKLALRHAENERPATMFGEPHVIKSARLAQLALPI